MISQEEQQQLLQLERERLAASEARRSIAEQEVIFLRAQLDDTRTNLEQALLQIRELGRRYGFDPTTQVYVSPGGYWLPQKQLFSTQAQQQQPDKEQQQAEQPPQPPHPPSEAGYATPDTPTTRDDSDSDSDDGGAEGQRELTPSPSTPAVSAGPSTPAAGSSAASAPNRTTAGPASRLP